MSLRRAHEPVGRAYVPPTQQVLAWVGRHVDPRARVIAVERLIGGITADMDRITVDAPTGLRDVVLRRWPEADRTHGLVAREAGALEAIRGHGVPAPHLVAMDETGVDTGLRCTLTTALSGEPDLTPTDVQSWLSQLATTQAAIHAVATGPRDRCDAWREDAEPRTSPDRYGVRPRGLDWLADHGLREAAREAASGPLDDGTVLIHGDYQHFNVLWRQGHLTGVVDWPNAGIGSRGSDVGHCRLNLTVLFDAEMADGYLAMYERAAGGTVDRRADLRALLCFDLEWQTFIPRQVAGRARLDTAGMAGRVAAAVRLAVERVSG